MKCYNHPTVDPVGTCVSCGRAICAQCAVEVNGKLQCRECLATGVSRTSASEKDPNTALLIEIVGGVFGLLGIGYIYAGRTNEGILRLALWLIYVAVAWVGITLLSAIIIGVVCIPVQLILQIGVPIWSGITLKNEMLA
jgi:TM2 domain-containing membrane protein YozV